MAHPYIFASKWDKIRIVLGIIIALAECVVDPISTIIIGKIFKDVENVGRGELTFPKFMDETETFCFVLVGLTFYSAIINSVGYMIWVTTGYSIGHKLRLQLYKVLALNPPKWYDEKSNLSGLAMMYYKDIQDIEVAAGITTYEIVAMGIGCLVQIGVAFYYSWAVTLICLVGIPVIIFVCSLFSPLITKLILKSKSQQEQSSEKINWILRAFDTVKIFDRSPYEWKQLHNQITKQKHINVKYWAYFHLQNGICRTLVLLVFVQGFYFGSYMVRDHNLSAGNVVTVFWSCLNASGLLQTCIGHFIEWNKGKASAERLLPVFSLNEDEILVNSIGLYPNKLSEKLNDLGWSETVMSASPATGMTSSPTPTSSTFTLSEIESCKDLVNYHGSITFTDVVFSYPSRSEIVLAKLNMEFKSQEITFVIGKSGSGKSTIASLLTKQYEWQAGEISIDGHGVDFLSKNWIEKNVYVCEQMPKLYDISIADNIKIGSFDPKSVTDGAIDVALRDSCAEFVYDLPNQLETSGSYPFSGGQLQRISLARARIRNSPILIYDESTSALDPSLQRQVYQRILQYRRGKTTIIITHNARVIPSGYPVYIMDNGEAERYDSITDIVNQGGHIHDVVTESANSNRASDVPYDTEKVDTDNDLNNPNNPNGTPLKSVGVTSQIRLSLDLIKSIDHKSILTLGYIVTTIHAAINPVFSFLFSKLVMGILDPNTPKVTMWAMLVLMCAFLDGIASTGKWLLNYSTESWQLKVRDQIMDKILNYKGPKFSHEQVSYFSKLLVNDTEKCLEVITLYWPALLSMLVLGLVGFIWALAVCWKLTLVGISLVPVFVCFNQLYKHLLAKWTGHRETQRSEVIRLMMDLTSLNGYRTMKVQHLEQYFSVFYQEREKKLDLLTPKMISQVGPGYGVLKCFPYALESLLLWYGMHLIGTLSVSTQSVITVFTLLMFTIVTIDQLTSSIGSIGPGFEALPRLMDAYRGKHDLTKWEAEQPRSVECDLPLWRSLQFRNFGVEFSNGSKVLGSFNADINSGELVALIGPSGIGKSTIGRVLEKLEPSFTGEILVDDDIDFKCVPTTLTRQNVCMVGQMPLDFFDGTIQQNLMYALNEHSTMDYELMGEACMLAGADKFIDELKNGYETMLKNGGQLSGGQMQRLGIARALMRQPRVLILDECTSALDYESKQIIMESLIRIRDTKNLMIIMITHQMDVAAYADKVIRL